ncbi:MAG: DUF1501 domain-containing protein, partial [Pirellulales bacterium]|nr:DUF1501 domain-containing protein [Pirellulales bacterium]
LATWSASKHPRLSPQYDYHPLLSRRALLTAGTLGALGLRLPELLLAQSVSTAAARACILVFMEGGPAHQDLWDMKPQAPAEVRGAFRPIASSLPGVQVCEHLPLLSQQMHLVTLVRSVHHEVVDHNAGAYYTLTGRVPVVGGRLIVRDEPDNFPPFGAVLAMLDGKGGAVPRFVHVPEYLSNNGYDLPGQRAGFLGPAHDPLVTGDPSVPGEAGHEWALPAEVSPARLEGRRQLLDRMAASHAAPDGAAVMDMHYRRAWELLQSSATRRAFNLEQEPSELRERYGLPDRTDRSVEARQFGGLPHLGQSLLLARRLIEAGVRLVTVGTGRRFDQAWDTHRQHFPLLERSLLPYFDRAFSALLADLHQRGLLEETLVVAMGEFGRTPRLGQITSGAGADAAGRDHWPHCYTVLLAGGCWPRGATYGRSDRHAAYPAEDPVTPADIAATIYAALGVDPQLRIRDPLGRPHTLAEGRPLF